MLLGLRRLYIWNHPIVLWIKHNIDGTTKVVFLRINNIDIVDCFTQNLNMSTLSMQLIGAVHAIERALEMVDYHIG
jgi:hypothetical protein